MHASTWTLFNDTAVGDRALAENWVDGLIYMKDLGRGIDVWKVKGP